MNRVLRQGHSLVFGMACAVGLLLSACGTVPASSPSAAGETAVYVRHPHVATLSAARTEPVTVARDTGSLPARDIVHFEFDSDEIRPLDRDLVLAHSRYMLSHPGARLRLEGHADERGGTEYNLGLGQRRAENVRRSMMQSGVPGLVLEAVSLGEEMPADPAHNEAAWAQNRRVELRYLSR